MSTIQAKSSFLAMAFAACALLAGTPAANAGLRSVSFDPAYGSPFPDLGWKGNAIVDFGTCDGPGIVTNLPASCNGALSFVSATVQLYKNPDPNDVLQTINFTGGQVAAMNFDGSSELTQLWSSPFNPVQSTIGTGEGDYSGNPAYFSLIFVGDYAQLFWFKNNPGNALFDPLVFPYVQFPNVLYYAGCYLAGPGDNKVFNNRCGLSSNLEGAGALLKITPVPEAETYAMMLAGLGALGFMARRRRLAQR